MSFARNLPLVRQRVEKLEERIRTLEAELSDRTKANEQLAAIGQSQFDRIRTLEAALREARKWIGDGEFSDGLDRGHWTPEYAAVVDLIDRTLPQSETKGEQG